MDKKKSESDIFTDLIDSLFEVIFEIFKFVLKVLTSLVNSKSGAVKKKIRSDISNRQKLSHVEKFVRKFEDRVEGVLDQSDIDCTIQTFNSQSLGFNTDSRQEFTYSDYDSNVPLSVVIGPPGWGKTVLLLNLIERDLSQGTPYIVIDPKASSESQRIFKNLSKRHNRKTYIFTLGSSDRFNPLRSMSPTQVVEALFRMFPNSHEYYGPRTAELVLKVCEQLKSMGEIFSFHTITDELVRKSTEISFDQFKEIYEKRGSKNNLSDSQLKDIFAKDKNLRKEFKIETQALRSNLLTICNSAFGELFKDDGHAISIDQVRAEGSCIYIGLPSLAYGTLSNSIGKVFVTETMIHAFRVMNAPLISKENLSKLSIYIDEAGDLLFSAFKSLPAQCREAQVNITIATQSLSDLKAISPNFLNQVNTYAGNFWTFKVPDPEDAEIVAGFFGTVKSQKQTHQVVDGQESGRGSMREKRDYIAHPDKLKNLPKFKALLKSGDNSKLKIINIRNIEAVFGEEKIQKQTQHKLTRLNNRTESNISKNKSLGRARFFHE